MVKDTDNHRTAFWAMKTPILNSDVTWYSCYKNRYSLGSQTNTIAFCDELNLLFFSVESKMWAKMWRGTSNGCHVGYEFFKYSFFSENQIKIDTEYGKNSTLRKKCMKWQRETRNNVSFQFVTIQQDVEA